jgi:ABC-2 type transport system permease protein
VSKVLAVVRREFVERVRTRTFWIWTFVGPVMLVGLIAFQIFLATRTGGERKIAVVDGTSTRAGARVAGELGSAINRFRFSTVTDQPGMLDSLRGAVVAKQLDGFLIITDSTFSRGTAEYRGSNASSVADMETLQRSLRQVVFSTRLERAGIDPKVVRSAEVRINLETLKITKEGVTGETGGQAVALAFGMAIVLYLAILIYGIQVMSSVLEEKTTKIVEVLISSLRPFQMMLGKVLGAGAVGLVQLAVWATSFFLLTSNQARFASMLGESGGAGGATGFRIPQVPLSTFAVFLTYFLLGYFLYAAIFAAVGAMSNSEAEARQVQAPVTMLLVVPYVSFFGILNDPHGPLATWMSMIPFFAPIAAPVRWAASPMPLPQLLGSVAILVATVVGVTWGAARIYRVGILMTGKRPSFREVIRWVRTA